MKIYLTSLFLFCTLLASADKPVAPVPVVPGVSLQLATYRRSVISNIEYSLGFRIPVVKTEEVKGLVIVTFNLKIVDQPLQVDFKQNADHVSSLKVNDKQIEIDLKNEHLLIAAKYLHIGVNQVVVNFIAGDASLNRNDDYLYTLLVPDHARTVFPCFDQPDLKAVFKLMLNVPVGWKVLANAVKRDSTMYPDHSEYKFAPSDKLSTYLFSFAAGKFTSVSRMIAGHNAEFLYRETDTVKIKKSVEPIFKAHEDAINFLQQWTGIPFPFQKVGFVAIPDFQFGGMEHPGAVQYKASALFLDDGATKDMLISRSNVLSHETAHMWFGDMVTMQWFNDVWMKEVFANFMADKITDKLMGKEAFDLKFLQDHYPAAYSIDRTQGANPIRQDLDNLQDAGSLYGNIIYHKAPIMMQQLELLMGPEKFQLGIREYLKKYAYSNATWNDLIAILSKYTTSNLYTWNKVWVNQPGRPVFTSAVYCAANNQTKIVRFTISQHPEFGEKRIWPQMFNVTFVYPDHVQEILVNMNATVVELKQAVGLQNPDYVIFNSNGLGYGLFPTGPELMEKAFDLKSPLQRASIYISAYENMLAGRFIKPVNLLNTMIDGISKETDETNLRLLTGYINAIYWEFILPANRNVMAEKLENNLWDAMQHAVMPNNKKILFNCYQSIYQTKAAAGNMFSIWKQQTPPTGVKMNEDDYTSLALTIALKTDTATNILKQQEDRVSNPDRKKRLEFLIPALSPNVQDRDTFFASLADVKNRRKEAWVTSALSYLNHPLRQQTSEKYFAKSLDLVEEIQKTGDIFFPQTWLQTVLGSYQDAKAAQTVHQFLSDHPNYNPKLKAKILQSADNLFRAQNLLPPN